MRSFKSNENIHKKEDGSYYVVSANKASSVTLQSPCVGWVDREKSYSFPFHCYINEKTMIFNEKQAKTLFPESPKNVLGSVV